MQKENTMSNDYTVKTTMPDPLSNDLLYTFSASLPHYFFEESIFTGHSPIFSEQVDWGGKIDELIDKYDEAWYLLSNR